MLFVLIAGTAVAVEGDNGDDDDNVEQPSSAAAQNDKDDDASSITYDDDNVVDTFKPAQPPFCWPRGHRVNYRGYTENGRLRCLEGERLRR